MVKMLHFAVRTTRFKLFVCESLGGFTCKILYLSIDLLLLLLFPIHIILNIKTLSPCLVFYNLGFRGNLRVGSYAFGYIYIYILLINIIDIELFSLFLISAPSLAGDSNSSLRSDSKVSQCALTQSP